MPPTIVFPRSELDHQSVDESFENEFNLAKAVGLPTLLVDDRMGLGPFYEAEESTTPAIYRGWMKTQYEYECFERWLRRHKKLKLINTPAQYTYCHYLPGWYMDFRDITPKSRSALLSDLMWGSVFDYEAICNLAASLGSGPAILKDFVKSQKHYWHEACFIPDCTDKAHVTKVVQRFIELQSPISGGLTFRRFEPFESTSTHPNGMPAITEIRTFWLNGCLVSPVPSVLPSSWLTELARRVKSNFFTMDLALHQDGSWRLVELGDGQVSGFRDNISSTRFYESLKCSNL